MNKRKLLFLLVLPLLVGCKIGGRSSSSSFSSEQSSSSESSEEQSSETTSSYSSEEVSSSESSSEEISSSEESSAPSTSFDSDLWDNSQNYLRTGTKEIDFYNLNDLHGSIESSESEPGIARISTYLANKRALNPDGYVITSSGDMWQGSADSNITRGALIDDWMDYEGFSAMALGNHEFDWTIDQIKTNQATCYTPFLACNIIYKDTGENVEWVKPYTTITRNGVHIGIIGAIGEGITTSILYNNVKNLTFDNPDKYVQEHTEYLKENGADVILYLYHETIYSIDYEISYYADAIFGGHSHSLESDVIGGVPAVQGKSNGKYVSHINLKYNFNSNTVTYGNYGYDDTDLYILDENPDVISIKENYAEQISAVKDVEVAKIPTYLSAYQGVPHKYNQYAYKYYQDNYGDREVYAVVTNNGRASISSGVVTYGDIYKALPFDNYLTLFKATGAHIKEITSYSSSHWYFPSISESHVDYSSAASYFEDETEYYVLSIDYISTGSYYSEWMELEETFMEESALPRNIFANYLSIEYPL